MISRVSHPLRLNGNDLLLADEDYMQLALTQADLAEQAGEVPVGAVLVYQGDVIASGYNQPIQQHDPSAHAEIVVLRRAGLHQQNYRLPNTTLYVTLEPCIMCLGALIQARIERLVFGATDPKRGMITSHPEVFALEAFNHRFEVTQGVLSAQCENKLKTFFANKR